ncbi:MAG: hypothetical protein L0215_12605 [Gemmataceae bacterium]|nr:hypothetical protein [Gemmataceae bacterium]
MTRISSNPNVAARIVSGRKMASDIVFEIDRHTASGLQSVAENWKSLMERHQEAMAVLDIEAMMDSASRFPEKAKQVYDLAFKRMSANEVEDYEFVGSKVRRFLSTVVYAMNAVCECIRLAEKAGYKVAQSEKFQNDTRRVFEWMEKFQKKWPWINEKLLLDSTKEDSPHRTVRDILNGLRNWDCDYYPPDDF